MKLRLPHSLFLFLLSLTVTLPSAADAVVGIGVSYDNGKGSYSRNPEANPTTIPARSVGGEVGDGLYCWANSAANMIQYWQDTYKDKLTDGAPNGFNSEVYGSPDGTRYLNVYEKFLSSGKVNTTGLQNQAIDWYFKGGADNPCDALNDNTQQILKAGIDAPKTDIDSSYMGGWEGIDYLTAELPKAFTQQGQSVGLSICQQDPADQLLSPEDRWYHGNTRSHAVTCWGYETDAAGKVNAMYLTDSDDLEFGVFKVHVSTGTTLPDVEGNVFDSIILSTDDNNDGYGGFVVSLQSVLTIETPESYAKSAVEAGTRLVPKLGNETELTSNTTISGEVKRIGAGVKVGGANEAGVPQIVMLVSDQGSSLTLKGAGSGTGLEVEQGSLASVANLNVSGYEHGVDAEGKVYLYGDTVNVTGNTTAAGDGAGINNANYVEIYGAGTVNITGNTATTGKGGGIYNAEGEVVSIRNKNTVNFSGNTAASGNDIYNEGGKVNIADNTKVTFNGIDSDVAAVVNTNGGELYLKSTEGGQIEFKNAALDSTKGTVYVGSDINGSTSATSLTMKEVTSIFGEVYDSATMTISGGSDNLVASLKNLKVTATEIAGVGAATSSISHADVYATNFLGVVTLANLRVDSSSKIRTDDENSVILKSAVVDLAGLTPEYQNNTYTFNLTDMFTGFDQILFDNLYLDASSCAFADGLRDADSVVVMFASQVAPQDSEADTITLALLTPDGMVSTQSSWNGANVTFGKWEEIPEPATSALSLLALAGLAARRRRR